MPVFVQQAAKGIFHGAGGGREYMGFNGRQVDDILPDKPLGNHEAIRVYLVQAEELISDIADGITYIDPGFIALVEMDVSEPMRLDNIQLLVFPLAEMGIDHDGAVMTGVDVGGGIPVLFHGPDYAIQLPGSGGAARIEEVPTDIDLQGSVSGF